MTKVTILGQEPKEKELKKIEFVKDILENGSWFDSCYNPQAWKYIDLICLNWRGSNLDLMRVYDDSTNGALVLGHFNDGIV